MKPPLIIGHSNDFQTPPIALKPLYKYLKPGSVIWECASGKGNLVRGLKQNGFKVIATDILTGENFITHEPEYYDYIITNPPYSVKGKFLRRAYELGKPFAFLLPLTTFETSKRQSFFKKYGLEVILFDKRINFVTPSGKGGGSWFATAWFTNGLNIGKALTFEKLHEEKLQLFQ